MQQTHILSMCCFIWIGVLLILLAAPVVADTPEDELVGEEDMEDLADPDPLPECGDGICQPEIRGVCPEDCDDELIQDDPDDGEDTAAMAQDTDNGHSGILVIMVGVLAGIALIGIVLYLSIVPEENQPRPQQQDNSESQRTEQDTVDQRTQSDVDAYPPRRDDTQYPDQYSQYQEQRRTR